MRVGRVVAAVVALGTCAPAARAQEPAPDAPPARRGGLGLRYLHRDSVTLRLRSRNVWRGVDLGAVALGGALDLDLWRIDGLADRHALTGRAAADLPLRHRGDAARTDFVQLAGGYRYRLDTEEGEANVGVTVHGFGGQPGERFTPELSASVQRRFDVPFSDRRPLFAAFVAHDFRRFDATYVEPSATFDLGFRSVGARLAARTSWSDYAGRGGAERAFGYHATALEVWGSYDRPTTAVGPLVAEFGVAHWWSRVDPRPRRFVATLQFVRR